MKMTNEKFDAMMTSYVKRDSETFTYHEKKHRRIRLTSAVAAALVLAVTLGVIFLPSGSGAGFTITAFAAATDSDAVKLSEKAFLSVAEINAGGESISANGSIASEIDHDAYFNFTISGDGIDAVTLAPKSAKIQIADDCDKLLSFEGKSESFAVGDSLRGGSVIYGDPGSADAAEYPLCFYDAVTCSYDRQLDSDDEPALIFGGISGVDYDSEIIDAYISPIDFGTTYEEKLSDEEFLARAKAYYDEVLSDVTLDVTVHFTDGKTETKTLCFEADCTLNGVEEQRYYAYTHIYPDGTKEGLTVPVHSFSEDVEQGIFPLSADDYEENPAAFNDWVNSNFANTDFSFSESDAITCYHYDVSVHLLAKIS